MNANSYLQNHQKIKGFHLRDKDATHLLYKKTNSNELIAAFRGTVKTDSQDLECNINIIQNIAMEKSVKNCQRYKSELQWFSKIKKQNPGAKFTLTGHSLGGTIAVEIAREYNYKNIKAVVFNPGDIGAIKKTSNIKIIRTCGDIASGLGSFIGETDQNTDIICNPLDDGSDYCTPASIEKIHSLSNFICD